MARVNRAGTSRPVFGEEAPNRSFAKQLFLIEAMAWTTRLFGRVAKPSSRETFRRWLRDSIWYRTQFPVRKFHTYDMLPSTWRVFVSCLWCDRESGRCFWWICCLVDEGCRQMLFVVVVVWLFYVLTRRAKSGMHTNCGLLCRGHVLVMFWLASVQTRRERLV